MTINRDSVWKPYDPEKPLISIWIPKCAGSSFRAVLEQWFGKKFGWHYFSVKKNEPPPRYELSAEWCVHGHFNRWKRVGVFDYYPEAEQMITILRNPLEIHLSNYFYWKHKNRLRQIQAGQIQENGPHDYSTIDDFFTRRRRSHIFKYFPVPLDSFNFKKVIHSYFVYIGLVEEMQRSVDDLAEILDKPGVSIPRVNRVERDETVSPKVKQKWVEENRLAFTVFDYINDLLHRK